VSAPGGQAPTSFWAENNRIAGELAQERIEAQELREQIHRLQRENERLLKELAGKREAMARVLDAYEIEYGEDIGRFWITTSDQDSEVREFAPLGEVVRSALRHAKGGGW